jgi:Zn-dependent alcohol dehydrogenase
MSGSLPVSIPSPIHEIVTHHYPLKNINAAMAVANERSEAIKVVIDMA